MSPNPEASPWPQGCPFPPGRRCTTWSTIRARRCWCGEARAAGLPAVTGLGMLVEQAALALELWTGRAVTSAVMFRRGGTAYNWR